MGSEDFVFCRTGPINLFGHLWCHKFLTSTFILPRGCLKRIESLCSRFLWSGNIDRSHGTKISWRQVCLPKVEGGLGMRRLVPWNNTLCLRLVWTLLSNKTSLWSKWHKLYNLRDTSFWGLEEATAKSWTWKSLL